LLFFGVHTLCGCLVCSVFPQILRSRAVTPYHPTGLRQFFGLSGDIVFRPSRFSLVLNHPSFVRRGLLVIPACFVLPS
jgi:hypothetical protein